MNSEIKTYKYDDGEIQRVQIVTLDSFDELNFFYPKYSCEALSHLAQLYKEFFVSKYPLLFGKMFIYHIPDDYVLPFKVEGIKDKYIASRIYLKENFNSKEAKEFLDDLKKRDCLHIIQGKNIFKRAFVPYKNIGFMSDDRKKSELKVNSSFFTFLESDVLSKYDIYGTPIGMYVKNGEVLNPPLFNREALLVDDDNNVEIRKISLNDLDLGISGKIYQRDEYKRTPKSNNYDLVIINDEIKAINYGGKTEVPSSGFVLSTKENNHIVGEKIIYRGLENISFGVQCGNSIIVENEKTLDFISKFTSIKKLNENNIPPSMYPLNFNEDRAPRIAIGESANHKPLIIWFEGKSKYNHEVGKESCGASLKEMADILKKLKVRNAINLDGGGSAQILLDNKRSLLISDRDKTSGKELERPIPIGIYK